MVGKNIASEEIHVTSKDLKEIPDSFCRYYCKECSDGIVLVTRDENNGFNLSPHAICLLCGQKYIFDDIEDLRGKDFARRKA